MATELFSVCRFFSSGDYEYVLRKTPSEKAFQCFCRLISSSDALTGSTTRVIITDGGDFTNAEWIFGKGLVYPTLADIMAGKKHAQ